MYDELIKRINEYSKTKSRSTIYSPTEAMVVQKSEEELGFAIPQLLKECYLNIANGGFGPGYGVIGLVGGYTSDFGDLVETYFVLKNDQELEQRQWKDGLLPFCEWGCNIFSCVDCYDPMHHIFTSEELDVSPQNYTLRDFFELWMDGADLLALDTSDIDEIEVRNPFTGEREKIKRRKRE